MLSLTNNKSINAIIKEKTMILYQKLIRTNNPHWTYYPANTRNLKTQNDFI